MDMLGLAPDGLLAPPAYSREHRRLVDYWRRIHPPAGLPGRQHFDPVDVPELLPHIWLLDVHRPGRDGDPWRFRFRLVGTAIVKFVGRDATGRWCEDMFRDFVATDAYRGLVACAAQGVPVWRTARGISKPQSTHRLAHRVHLPLASDGRNVDVILSLTRYIPADAVPPGD